MSDKPTERMVRKHLKELTERVMYELGEIDREMRQPQSPERGNRIAAISNRLEMANDRARYFGLGIDWRKDKKATP